MLQKTSSRSTFQNMNESFWNKKKEEIYTKYKNRLFLSMSQQQLRADFLQMQQIY